MEASYYKQKGESVIVNVYLLPASSKDEIVGAYGEYLKIKVKSAPVDNKANENLIKFLAKILKVSIGQIEIIKGYQSKRKIVCIKNINENNFRAIVNK